ncbi:MAG: hypothetical protein EZS28_004633 [Streblomastix strix]|uniref:Cyclin N-terminal domain-containing protein n=1 Tax=Streblomastix strix TaxID=222440 RepID=A0A5J4X061_9EUKA|nr:MAG: hypothetical protein EZS28_004633 [Streblomastix strix]
MDKASSSQSTKYSLLQQEKSNLVLDLINLPSDQHIEKLSQFLTDIVQASISGAADFVTLENVKIFLQYVRQNAQLTLSEILVALQTLEILLQKSKEKGRTIVNTDNLGTALVCVCGLVLKFLRDQPYKNSWWSNAFSMDIHTLAESELVILEVMDWQIWINEKNFIRFAQRVVQGDKLFKS